MAREFQRGHKARLADLTAERDLYVGVRIAGPGLSFDISCFGLDGDERLSDDRYFVFYNQPVTPEEAVRQLGPQDGDTDSFRVALDRVPPHIRKLTFTAALDGAGQMAQIGPGCLRVVAGGQEVARYPFTGGEFSTERAVMLGDLYLKDVWRFAAVGQGFDGGLEALLTNFGGEVLEEGDEPAGPPTPPATAPPATAQGVSDFPLPPPAPAPAAPPVSAVPAAPAPPVPTAPDPRAPAPAHPQQNPPPLPQPAAAAEQIHSAPTLVAPLVPPGGPVPPGVPGPPPPPPPAPGMQGPPPPPPPLPYGHQQPPAPYGQQPPPPPRYGQQPPPPPYGQQSAPPPYGQQPPPLPGGHAAPQGPPVPLPPPAPYGQPGQQQPGAPYPGQGVPLPEDGGTGPWHRPEEPGAHGAPPQDDSRRGR
ncbi:TerD family protein [Streptomyces sp. BHT-5-2]|nr:TerD family protein [Streptomyces sp. BHT-5-2]